MGIFDDIRRLIDTVRGTRQPEPADHAQQRRRTTPASPEVAAVEAAQERRRAEGVTRASGKPARRWHVEGYERLERQITLRLGKFPWTRNEARDVLRDKGFDPDHAEAYLKSPAARRLLE